MHKRKNKSEGGVERASKRPITDWDKSDVAAWISEIADDNGWDNGPKLAKAFKENDVSGPIFKSMTIDEFTEIGVPEFGRRKTIIRMRDALLGGSGFGSDRAAKPAGSQDDKLKAIEAAKHRSEPNAPYDWRKKVPMKGNGLTGFEHNPDLPSDDTLLIDCIYTPPLETLPERGGFMIFFSIFPLCGLLCCMGLPESGAVVNICVIATAFLWYRAFKDFTVPRDCLRRRSKIAHIKAFENFLLRDSSDVRTTTVGDFKGPKAPSALETGLNSALNYFGATATTRNMVHGGVAAAQAASALKRSF